ncbi:MAG: methionine--tRNA ligase [Rhodospirillales bacterium]|nr:methionine--tRNA ligase [Rhodospirillaceae bacterium]MDP6430267.1 methionine--tRNA ligase [Rhodospirillales bacterium]MDP6643926.1 methionine--tRNA ligase [Rhodospirillales bacterium]
MPGKTPNKTSGKTPYYITTAISYVNGPPHLGHAYEAISTDVMARFKHLDGYDVIFLTGTDEHGQKVEKSAIAAGKDPRAFCDEIAGLFRDMCTLLNISNDDFIRTTEPRHYAASQAIWLRLADAGDIYLGNYAGWYSVRDEAYFHEDELSDDPANPGGKLAPSGAPAEWVEEPSYFFKLSEYTQPLLDHYQAHPDFIMPATRKNEVVSFVSQGLRDLSLSRTTFKWGVPVPGDPGHIMYVWLDALTNYITALGFPEKGIEGREDVFETHWPADLHVIGKDIVRFHAVYWPAFLMSAGVALPKRVFGHGFLNIEGEKMSKSLGNVLSPAAMVEEFGLDPMRYFLLREVPYGQDGSFSREAIIQRINADLANDFGNLAQRVLSMINKNCGGIVPEPGALQPEDETLLGDATNLLAEMREAFEVQAFHTALEKMWTQVRAANAYIDHQAPWTLRKENPERMQTVLYVLGEAIRRLGILAGPFMPDSAAKMLDQLAVGEAARDFSSLGADARWQAGIELPKPEGVFPRHVEEEAAE